MKPKAGLHKKVSSIFNDSPFLGVISDKDSIYKKSLQMPGSDQTRRDSFTPTKEPPKTVERQPLKTFDPPKKEKHVEKKDNH